MYVHNISTAGCQIFLQHTKTGKNISNDYKGYQKAIRYTKWLSNTPNAHKIQGRPK
jgi:hypothetical protein